MRRSFVGVFAVSVGLTILALGANQAHSAVSGGAIDSSCSGPSPCVEYDNTGSGPGVRGVSSHGFGINGQTKARSTSNANGKSGVLGQDLSTSATYDSGVSGTSVNGSGVFGTSTNGDGVRALSTNGIAVEGYSNNSYGVSGSTSNSGSGIAGVRGVDESTGLFDAGVAGTSTNGYGVLGFSTNGEAGVFRGGSSTSPGVVASSDGINYGNVFLDVAFFGINDSTSAPAMDIWNASTTGPGLIVGTQAGSMVYDGGGNLTIPGKIFTGGSCSSGCVVTKSTTGQERTTYSARGPRPSIEDFGQGTMAGGSGHVTLDPDFASLMDPHASYLVFLTPEGDNRGLYVTQKTRSGFEVVESQGGHSSLVFDYRIVAKPYAEDDPRLPIFNKPDRGRLPRGHWHASGTHNTD